ncbi:MAG TPA: hypothetical protein EYP19_04925 [Desulfobacterales bacterium]|nr:hypothetical protein [Desulfobacterales bacterium]
MQIGIHLGVENSEAALMIGGTPQMVEPAKGPTGDGNVFPSYVAFDSQGRYSCAGLPAKNQFVHSPDLVVRHFKRLIGRPFDFVAKEIEEGKRFLDEFKDRIERGDQGELLIRVGKKRYTCEDITSFLLEKIKSDADEYAQRQLGKGISGAVITVPVDFDVYQRSAVMAAGEKVFGKGNVGLIEEPFAAVIARGIEKDQETIMVVNMDMWITDVVISCMTGSNKRLVLLSITRLSDD